MAEQVNKSNRRKRPQTVRERVAAQQPAAEAAQPKKAGLLKRFFLLIGRTISRLARPFKFLLAPFKTRPVRFIGRILAKIFFINYFISSWKELRKVSWPNRKETIKLTLAVFAFAIVFGAVIALVDFGLDKVFRKILLS